MIHLFAVCKNDYFIKALSRLLQPKGVVLIDTCNQLDLAVIQYLVCAPIPDIVLLDANWTNVNTSTVDLMRQFLSI